MLRFLSMKLLTFGCLLLLTTAAEQQPDAARPDGSIYGVAIASDGQLAKRVGLTAMPLGVPLSTVLPNTTTNDRGEYRFVHLPWWGRYTVYAEDEEAGYSSFSTGGYGQTQPPEIEITSARREAELRVNLPPKAAFLRVHLTNGRTGALVSGMKITVMYDTNPPSLAFGMSCFSTKAVLLAPDRNVLIHITSDGFREWKGSLGKGKVLHLASGSQLTLDVKLDPANSTAQTVWVVQALGKYGLEGFERYGLISTVDPRRKLIIVYERHAGSLPIEDCII
jgi:hypothetical protein